MRTKVWAESMALQIIDILKGHGVEATAVGVEGSPRTYVYITNAADNDRVRNELFPLRYWTE